MMRLRLFANTLTRYDHRSPVNRPRRETQAIFAMNDYRPLGTNWPEHWTNGGTAISKGCAGAVADSVAAFGDPAIFMRGEELHSTRKPMNLSDFWEFHLTRNGGKY